MLIYIFLNITAYRRKTVYMLQEINRITFAVVTVQQPNNINNLTFTTMAGLVIILPF